MDSMTRRRFLASAAGTVLAGAAAPALRAADRARIPGANDRIRIGIIGCGDRGINAHMRGIHKHLKATNFEITAVADPWRLAREEAAALSQEWFGRAPRQFVSYRDLLEVNDLDAVMIASPDHLHTLHLEAVARAGKHVYVEKPMAQELEPLIRAVDAVKESGVIAQVGTQIRSLPEIVACRQLFESGIFGKVSRVEEARNGEKPYWYGRLKPVRREDVDWDEFLGDIPRKPFREDYYSAWYGYYDTSRGPIPNLGAHFIDLVHYITGAQFPTSCVCLGGIYTWADEHQFTAPDCIQALWEYPEGFMVSSSNNLGNGHGSTRRLLADRGVLDFTDWSSPFYHAEGAARRVEGSIRGRNDVKPAEQPDHFLNWLQCLRSGKQPHAPIEAGYHHSIAVIMAMKSYETGRKMIYDPEKREIRSA